MPLGLGLNPGENMYFCKRLVNLLHGATLNSCRVASPLVRLVEGNEREAPDHPYGVLPQNWGGKRAKSHCNIWCSKLRLTTDVQQASCHTEFRGP
ncbi:uncharacterized protein TNCV_2716331 [Trichonephila clavipes]|nr:uncharacterized protein TNCV_2716331 [Trichonephila clavipes]